MSDADDDFSRSKNGWGYPAANVMTTNKCYDLSIMSFGMVICSFPENIIENKSTGTSISEKKI